MEEKEQILLRAKKQEEYEERMQFLEKELRKTIKNIQMNSNKLRDQQKLLNVFKAIEKYHDTELAKKMGRIKVFTIYENEIYNLYPPQSQKRYDDILETAKYLDTVRQQFIKKINELEKEMRDNRAGSNDNIKNQTKL